MNQDLVNISAVIDDDHRVVITKEVNHKTNLPPFHGIGGNTEMTTKIKGYPNLYEVLQNLSKTASWFWWGLMQVRVIENNKCIFKAKDNREAKKVTLAYKELLKHDLIRRIKPQVYMVNPIAMLPLFKRYSEVQEEWDKYKLVAEDKVSA